MKMNTFYVLFAAAIIAAAKRPEMKASFNNNLPNQIKGVMVNPRNPDSKAYIGHIAYSYLIKKTG